MMRPVLTLKGNRMVQHEKHPAHQQEDTSKKAPHQGPVPAPSQSEELGGTGSPTSGPTGEPLVKPPEQPPGQPKEGESSAAGEVGETDLPSPEAPKKK